ncbi:MAG: hypothetical protein NTW80_10705 [Deltaproteobacteria bacterium]|nr:hypothetical protein [Deltaproteobacteria bacterium]
MEDEQYFWDLFFPKLVEFFGPFWSEPKVGLNRRKQVATLFAMRAFRRLPAVDGLFKKGLYLESHPLVRAGYEDWIYLAFLLREPGSSRCEDFRGAVNKLDARVYDAFRALCGQAVTDSYFGIPPDRVATFVGCPRSQTRGVPFAKMADDVGLRLVHDFVYAYLSGMSHPDGRLHYIFEVSESIIALIPKRDPAIEIRLALWFAWFTSRILVLASNEFGIDHEHFVDEYLAPIAKDSLNIETCVFVCEYNQGLTGS